MGSRVPGISRWRSHSHIISDCSNCGDTQNYSRQISILNTFHYSLLNLKKMSRGKILLGVLAGVAAGATLGILLAPDSGANTRKKIKQKGDDLTGSLKSQFNNLVSSLNDEVDEFKDGLNQLAADGKAKYEDGKQKFEEGKQKANNVKENFTSAVS